MLSHLGGKLEGFWHLGCIRLLLHSRLQIISLQAFLICLFVFPSLPFSCLPFLTVQGLSSAGAFLQGLAGPLAAHCWSGHFADTLQPWHPLCKFCFWPAGLDSAVLEWRHLSTTLGQVLGCGCCAMGWWIGALLPGSAPGVRPGCSRQAGVLDSLCHWTKGWKFGFNPLLQISWSCQRNAHSGVFSSFLVAVYVAKGTAGSRSNTCS